VITVKYVLTFEDHAEARRWKTWTRLNPPAPLIEGRLRGTFRGAVLSGCLLVTLSIIYIAVTTRLNILFPGVPAVILAGIVGRFFVPARLRWLPQWKLRKEWARLGIDRPAFILEAGPDGAALDMPRGWLTFPWRSVLVWENPKVIYIQVSVKGIYIPKRYLDAQQLQQLRQWAGQS